MDSIRFVGSTPVFDSPRFSLAEERFETPDGSVTRPIIHHPGAVAILAQPDARSIVLVRQFRYPVRKWTFEIPAGTRIPGEDAEATAHRELREESGYLAETMIETIRFYPAVGVSDEMLIVFRADGLRSVDAAPEHGELVSRAVTDLRDLEAMVAAGEICDAKTLIAMSLLGIPVIPTVQALQAAPTAGTDSRKHLC